MKLCSWFWVAVCLLGRAAPSVAEGMPDAFLEQAVPKVKVLHLAGPVGEPERMALEKAGARILEALPPRGYLVEFPEGQSLKLASPARLAPWKLADKLSEELREVVAGRAHPGGPVMLRAVTFRGRTATHLLPVVSSLVPPQGLLKAKDDATGRGTLWVRVVEERVAEAALTLASHPDVVWVERYALEVLKNENTSWLIQSGSAAEGRTIWRHGITGYGQVVGVADSGLDADACQFRYSADRNSVTTAIDTVQPPQAIESNPGAKIITYYVVGAAEAYDDATGGYHGTHTTGNMVGDNYEHLATATAAGHDLHDGMAPAARVVVQDIGSNNGELNGLLGVSMYDLLKQAHETGVRVHNNSYGSAEISVAYDISSASIDAAMWELNDLLVVFAAGNSGADSQGSPVPKSLGGTGSTSKNTLAVGASGPVELNVFGSMMYLENDLLFFSSQGPTADGRFKPDVVAPGLVFSATSDTSTAINLGCCDVDGSTKYTSNDQDNNCNVDQEWPTMGTSFSSPLTVGAATLVRQYFTDGFWYAGEVDPGRGFNPTNALLKSAIINGATPLTGVIIGMQGSHPLPLPPSGEQGWGRVYLENVLFFKGDEINTLLLNDTPNPVPSNPMFQAELPPFPYANPPLATGEEASWTLPVTLPDFRLKITLAWSDPPATPGSLVTLVNDLDLTAVAPGGETYRGNREYNQGGYSLPEWRGNTDAVNNVEQINVREPEGSFRLTVTGKSVAGNGDQGSTSQGYALVVTGKFLPPMPESIKPSRGLPGDQLTNVQVVGNNFVEGMEISLAAGVTANGVEVIDQQTALIGSLSIDPEAELGPRDVTAIVLRTIQGTGKGLFVVGKESTTGCGCGAEGTTSGGSNTLLCALALAWMGEMVRRRRVSDRGSPE